MKIGVITCHNVYNYGASLQAHALQHYLEQMGNEVEIIDYNPWFHRDRYNPFWLNRKLKDKRAFLLKYVHPYRLYRAYRNGMFKTWGRKSPFDHFTKTILHLTSKKYKSIDGLRKFPPMADIYIAGSDQIWNTNSENGKDPSYYLDFGSPKRRISYAASLATSTIAEGWEDFVKREVEKFDYVSVREKTGVALLKSLGIGNVEMVLDPVFLLDAKYWSLLSEQAKCGKNIERKSYLLLYDFLGNNTQMRDFAKMISQKNGFVIVSINDLRKSEYADININNAGPLEFLWFIKNASCVISNSFHATAFSIIFRRNFYTYSLNGHNNSSRMVDFLSMLGLAERFDTADLFLPEIDYEEIGRRLESYQNRSKCFINTAISIQ